MMSYKPFGVLYNHHQICRVAQKQWLETITSKEQGKGNLVYTLYVYYTKVADYVYKKLAGSELCEDNLFEKFGVYAIIKYDASSV